MPFLKKMRIEVGNYDFAWQEIAKTERAQFASPNIKIF